MLKNTKKLTIMAMMIAISVVLVYLVHFPIFPSAAFLEYDPADVPILICAFAFGPIAGVIVTFAASLIQALTVSAASGLYGFIMHFAATGAFCVAAGIIYKYNRTLRGAIIGLICGILVRTAVMLILNHFVTPGFMGVPTEVVDGMLLPVMLPFNLICATVNSVITYLLYNTVSTKIIKNDNFLGRKK